MIFDEEEVLVVSLHTVEDELFVLTVDNRAGCSTIVDVDVVSIEDVMDTIDLNDTIGVHDASVVEPLAEVINKLTTNEVHGPDFVVSVDHEAVTES